MCSELGVHVPSELLGRCLRVVILLLWRTFERLELLLQDPQVLLVVPGRLGGRSTRVCLRRLLRNCDHCKDRKDVISVTTWVIDVALTILGVEVELLLEDASLVFFSDSFDPACVDLNGRDV